MELAANIVFVIGFLLACGMVYIPHRRIFIACIITYSLTYTVSFYLVGEYAGAASCLIAGMIALVNLAVPDEKLAETFRLRLTITFFACLLFGAFTVSSVADVMPFLSMMMARLSESLDRPEKIKMGHAISGIIWVSYVWGTGNILFATLETARWLNNLFSLYIDFERNKAEKVPALKVVLPLDKPR